MWNSDAASDVTITVTLTVDTEVEFNNTVIDFTDDPGSSTVSLRIRNVNDCASAHGQKVNSMLMLVLAVLSSLLISRWSGSHIWLLLTGLLLAVTALQACANDCTERADVVIFVPR